MSVFNIPETKTGIKNPVSVPSGRDKEHREIQVPL